MSQFRWIKSSLFLLLLLQFAAISGQFFSIIVRDGDEVTLASLKGMQDQNNCDGTDWILTRFGYPVDLVTRGKIKEKAAAVSDRLSVTENCSLVIKNVSVQDAGIYYCRSGQSDTQFPLSVIKMNKHDDGEWMTLTCLVSTHDGSDCRHKVEWMHEGEKGEEDIRYEEMQSSQYECSVRVTFPTSYLNQKSNHLELFKCKVKDGYSEEVHLFPFSPPQHSGEDVTTAKTSTTRITESSTKPGASSAAPTVSVTAAKTPSWWMYIGAALGLVALLIIITVAVIRWKRTKGNETQMGDNTGQSLNPAANQPSADSSQDTADPEDGVSYASVSFKKKSDSRAQVQVKIDDDVEGDSVTYSAVKASSSLGASADPSDLYATVKKKTNRI